MEIKQDYKDKDGHNVNFTYIGTRRGVAYDGHSVTFIDGDKKIKFYITEIAELVPYFETWSRGA